MPRRVIALAALVVLSISAAVVSFAAGWIDLQTLRAMVERPGPTAMLTYMVAVFVVEFLWFPRMWGLFIGGLVFGPYWGMVLSMVADMCSAAFCFALARTAGRAWVAAQLRRWPRAQGVVSYLAHRRGLLTVAIVRALPVHYTAASYASGVAGVSWAHFMFGTLIGLIPGALLYNFAGDAVRQPTSPAFIVVVVALALWLLVSAVAGRRFWKRRQQEREEASARNDRPDGERSSVVSDPNGEPRDADG